MATEKISIIKSTYVPLPIENIDTDQIIPARFLKSTSREGFGEKLFYDWRYDADGNIKKDFVLNRFNEINFENTEIGRNHFGSKFEHPEEELCSSGNLENNSAKILVAGKNFGCGSSREHAAWAIDDYGFRIVISSFFADIFRNNALNNGVLPVRVSEEFLDEIFIESESGHNAELEVNLEEQKITICSSEKSESFDISSYKKECLMKGYDDIDYLIERKGEIEEFETKKQ